MSSSPWGFREGHPTRIDLLMTVLAGVLAVENVVTADSLPVEWVAAGFVLTAVALGPVASSRAGARIGELARSASVVGRTAVVVGVVAFFWLASLVVEPATVAATSFATGMLAAVVVFGVLEAVGSWVGTDG